MKKAYLIKDGSVVGICPEAPVTSPKDDKVRTQLTVIFPDGHRAISKSTMEIEPFVMLMSRGCNKDYIYVIEEI